jgi:hypothetical protein
MFKSPVPERGGQWRALGIVGALLLLLAGALGALPGVLGARVAAMQAGSPAAQTGTPIFQRTTGRSLKNDVSLPLRQIPPAKRIPVRSQENERIPFRNNRPLPAVKDAVLQNWFRLGAAAMPTPSLSFEGNTNRGGFTPPDTNGDVGPNHYVQTVNVDLAVWSKAGTLLYGPVPVNTLWYGFGGTCEFTNDGDPNTVYDPIADRWVISQFGVPGDVRGYHECIAVSTSPDPTGSYNRYDFFLSPTLFHDYPQLGVWPDGYYASFNVFNPDNTFNSGAWVAFDRDQMLAGQPAGFQEFNSPEDGGMMPSDLDGTDLPPAGAPNTFVEPFDPAGTLRLWNFYVDWNNPANSHVGGPVSVPVAAWNPYCPGSDQCVPQPGTPQLLDPVSDGRIMRRLAYRNFGGEFQSWVANFTVSGGPPAGNGISGVAAPRWFELRSAGAFTPTLSQEGTYAPDFTNRWMASIAQDRDGNLAMGYSVSSSTVFPGTRYTGRLASDPPGTLPQGEVSLVDGGGSQTGSNRWGDFTNIAVDPVDDCTFWYTNEYYPVTSPNLWHTRIGTFKFPTCGSGGTPTPVTTTPVPSATPHDTPTSTPGPSATPTPIPIVACAANAFTGAITGADALQTGQIQPDLYASTCDVPKGPRTLQDTQPRRYDAYTFYNATGSAQCVTIRLTTPCGYDNNQALTSAAYLDSFNPATITQNYLGDLGYTAPTLTEYQVTVPANRAYVVVVSEYGADTGCPSYSLQVSCGVAGGTPTPTVTNTPTNTPTPTATDTPTITPTPTATDTPTVTPTPTATDTPLPTPTPFCDITFTDVPVEYWAYGYIKWAFCGGIVSGYADNTFRPEANASRGQVAKMVMLAGHYDLTIPPGAPHFSDVPPQNAFYTYIEAAYRLGVISGYDDGTFHPYGLISRAQLTKIVVAARGYTLENPATPTFNDVPSTYWAYPYIETAFTHQLIGGYTCGSPGEPCPGLYFRPGALATRAQLSKILFQAFAVPASQRLTP